MTFKHVVRRGSTVQTEDASTHLLGSTLLSTLLKLKQLIWSHSTFVQSTRISQSLQCRLHKGNVSLKLTKALLTLMEPHQVANQVVLTSPLSGLFVPSKRH